MGFPNGFASYSSLIGHALGDKCQTSFLSDIDTSSDGDMSICGERGDSPVAHSAYGSLDSDSRQAGDGSYRSSSPGMDSLKSARQRTAQACDKCRERKTKCSGNRPVCNRCGSRGLICEYSVRESRVRTPIRARPHPPMSSPNPLQVNFHDTIRPTPAYHSRMGHGQSKAFVSGPYPQHMSAHPLPPSSSLNPRNGWGKVGSARVDEFCDQPVPIPMGLGIGLPPRAGPTTSSNNGISVWDLRADAFRPQSAPITPHHRATSDHVASSHGLEMEVAVPQSRALAERPSLPYDIRNATSRGGKVGVQAARAEDSPYRRSPLATSTARRDSLSDWYKALENSCNNLTAPRFSDDARPSSVPTIPVSSAQHDVTPAVYSKSLELNYAYNDFVYPPNLDEWTGPCGVNLAIEPERTVSDSSSFLAAHFDGLNTLSADPTATDNQDHTTGVVAGIPGSLEVQCPAPLLPIGAGPFQLSASSSPPTDRPTGPHHPLNHEPFHPEPKEMNFDAMCMSFIHLPNGNDLGEDINDNAHRRVEQHQPTDAMFAPMVGHSHDFSGFDYFDN